MSRKGGNRGKQRLYGGTREYHLRRRYGIGEKEFQELLAAQGGACAICGAEERPGVYRVLIPQRGMNPMRRVSRDRRV